MVKGPEQGQVQLFMDEAPVGPMADLYAESRQRVAGVEMGTLPLVEGPNTLLFKIVGKNGEARGQALDVVNIVCEKMD